jgi:large subunit ribosomal protein L15
MANLHSLYRVGQVAKTRVGRGGKRGKTAGRGTKGQSARAGNKKRPEIRDIIKKLPKRRGYGKNRAYTVDGTIPNAVAISVGRLEVLFETGAEINASTLFARGIVKGRGSRFPAIKIVSGGTLTKKLIISGVGVSMSARTVIEKAGGTVPVLVPKKIPHVHAPVTPAKVKAKKK